MTRDGRRLDHGTLETIRNIAVERVLGTPRDRPPTRRDLAWTIGSGVAIIWPERLDTLRESEHVA